MSQFEFAPLALPDHIAALRAQVRAFLKVELAHLAPAERAQSWVRFDAGFSRKLGARGWIGMLWPKRFGGHERSALERYVVIEELLAAGAPVAAHWIADRQSGPLLLRYGSAQACERFLPAITRGEAFFCIGMSEPAAGSDLAAIKTRAARVAGGWTINGSKLWTTNADQAHVMIALVRTRSDESNRHAGLSQFLIDLSSPGVSVRALADQAGHRHFGEVFLTDVFVSDAMLLGEEGRGWEQVTAELALERSGPERFLSSYRLLEELVRATRANPSDQVTQLIGIAVAELWTLRQMSMSVAGQLSRGENPALEATVVKDLGTSFEQSLPHLVQAALGDDIDSSRDGALGCVLSYLLQATPSFSLRGGTREILRGIIARGLGLR